MFTVIELSIATLIGTVSTAQFHKIRKASKKNADALKDIKDITEEEVEKSI